MKTLHKVSSTVVLLALAAAAGLLHGQDKKEELPHPKTLDELKQAMAQVAEKNHLPGAGVADCQRRTECMGGIGWLGLRIATALASISAAPSRISYCSTGCRAKSGCTNA